MRALLEKCGEVFGFILFLLLPIIQISLGTEFDDYIFSQVVSIVDISLILREYYLLLFYGMLLLLFLTLYFYIKYPVRSYDNSHYWFLVVTRVISGWILCYWLLYSLINQEFYRGAVVTFPYLLGSSLLLLTILGMRNDQTLLQFIKSIRLQETQNQGFDIKQVLGWLRPFRYITLIIISLIILLPNMLPLTGIAASPPGLPPVYGGDSGPYNVEKIRLNHDIPKNISQYLIPDNNNNSWYIFIYLPVIPSFESIRELPVVLYAHGYTGTDPSDYENSLYQLASRGSIVIFVQYVTDVELSGEFAEPEETTFTTSNAMYFRYLMEWSGILQAVDQLSQTPELIDNGIININYIQIIGHSVGGGMVPYLATRVVEQGWGLSQLLLDMETPAFAGDHILLTYNLSILPQTTMVNIVGSQDDHLISPCIGMSYFEEFYNILPSQNLAYLIIPSDFYGFPRLVATHYVVTTALDDTLTRWGYMKRVDAMTAYLGALANVESTMEMVNYFLGGLSLMTGQGEWSDGVPVNELVFSLDPYGLRGQTNIAQSYVNSHEIGSEICVK